MEARSSLLLLGYRKRRPFAQLRPQVKALCRARALKRWSALVTQTKSRIGFKCGMRNRLGGANWCTFVKYAENYYKEAFVRALTPETGELCCNGKVDGTPCPKEVSIDLHTIEHTELGKILPGLHMDHTYDVGHICNVWSRALPREPPTCDDGICGEIVAHLLFGTEDHVLKECTTRTVWHRQLVVRCGNTTASNQHAGDFCHDVSNAHYGHILRVEDIAWPAEGSQKIIT